MFFGGDEHDYFSYPMYRELRDRNSVLSGILASSEAQVGVQWTTQPELSIGGNCYWKLFRCAGKVQPALGRLLIPADDAAASGIRWWR